VRHEIVGAVPATLSERLFPEDLEFLEKRTSGTQVEDVLSGTDAVQQGVVDMGKKPVGSQLDISVSCGSQSLLTKLKKFKSILENI